MDSAQSIGENLRHLRGMASLDLPQMTLIFAEPWDSEFPFMPRLAGVYSPQAGPMENIKLGKSSIAASRLAYGCWRLTGTWDSKQVTSEGKAAGKKAAIAAYEAGYTLFDHADIYCDGEAELLFGEILRDVPGMRDGIVIASKCGIRKAGDTVATAPYRYDFSKDYTVRSCEGSLNRMRVEMIDLYQLHRPDLLGDPEEVASAFSELKAAGKVREFGVSNFTPSQLTMLQKACPMPLIVHQFEISLAHPHGISDGALDQCLTDGITPLAWSPLARGKLGTTPVKKDFELAEAGLTDALATTLDRIARELGTSRSVLALAWLLKHPSKVIPIIGSTNPQNIKDAIQATELKLSREDWYRLMEASLGRRLP